MFYITGDLHGQFDRILQFCQNHVTKKDKDVMIVLGDVGTNYYGDKRDIKHKRLLEDLPLTFLFVRGNHESRPIGKDKYVTNEMFGGTFNVEDSYPSLLYMLDGNDYRLTVRGKRLKVLNIGGAYSVDKYHRLEMQANGFNDYKWFADEQLTDNEKANIIKKLDEFNRYDYIFSHTCPISMEPVDTFLPFVDQSTVNKSMEEFLEQVKNKVEYQKWYCGHWHINRTVDKFKFLFDDILMLGEFAI